MPGYEMVHASREFRTLRRRLGSFVVPAVALFLGWYFLYVLIAAFAPGLMRTLDNPGIVSIPVGFFLGWLGSVTDRHPADPARFARMQVRALTGVGTER